MSASVQDARFCVSSIFRAVWPRNTAKHVARVANRSTRTAEGWLARRTCPSDGLLLRMASHNAQLKAELIRRLETFDDADMVRGVVTRDADQGRVVLGRGGPEGVGRR